MERLDISQEVGNTAWKDSLGIECQITKKLFDEHLQKFTDNKVVLQKRQHEIRNLREKIVQANLQNPKQLLEIEQLFRDCKNLEHELQEFESAPKEWEKEGKSQIVFTQEWAKPLNHIPFLLPTAAIFKIYIFPFFL
jgi:hypothetical protein